MLTFSITPNKMWLQVSQMMTEMPKRYEWFQFEFGKSVANIFMDLLNDEITGIRKGPKDYKKRMVVAEIRDTDQKFWFAVVARAVPMNSTIRTTDNTVLKVVTRFPAVEDDPITEILQKYGPWTVETIPYIPSKRFAVVVAEPASKAKVESVKQVNKNKAKEVQDLMRSYRIEYDLRIVVAQKLKIVEDLEKVVNEMEFALGPRYDPSWSRAMRKLKTAGIRKLLNERDLIASLTDPQFKKYRVKTHLKNKMNSSEVRDLEAFQKRLLKIV